MKTSLIMLALTAAVLSDPSLPAANPPSASEGTTVNVPPSTPLPTAEPLPNAGTPDWRAQAGDRRT